MNNTILVLILVLLVVAAGYGWYVSIIVRRNKVDETLGGIDAQLQKRHDLIPNVLRIARRFLDHEKQLLTEIVELREKAGPQIGERDFSKIGDKFQVEALLGAEMRRLFALAENYPELTSSGPMMEAQRAYQDVERNIAGARRFYNSAVAGLRNAVQIFPGSLIAPFAGVHALPPFFQATENAAEPVNASDYL